METADLVAGYLGMLCYCTVIACVFLAMVPLCAPFVGASVTPCKIASI